MLKIDGFDECIIGIAQIWGKDMPVVVYDIGEIIEVLIEEHDMSREEAVEWMEFNVVGAWVGETTPIFVHEIPSDQKVDEFLEDLGFEPPIDPISPSNDN